MYDYDFLIIEEEHTKSGSIIVKPDFRCRESKDLMIKGQRFFALYMPETGMWTTNTQDLYDAIDARLYEYANNLKSRFAGDISVATMERASSGSVRRWNDYCKNLMYDNYKPLDADLTLPSDIVTREDYRSRRTVWDYSDADCPNYKKAMSRWYDPGEQHKLDFAVGSMLSGDSKNIQKFYVLYGEGGTGKGSWFKILQMLMEGYWASCDITKLVGSSEFPYVDFVSDPYCSIDGDNKLDRIETNVRLNGLVAHEEVVVNEKFKQPYPMRFKTTIFVGSNSPVQITDARSGLLRRLIDVHPTGDTWSKDDYEKLMAGIKFELGAIAKHCLNVYLENPKFYDDYRPTQMLSATNDFYNFMEAHYITFANADVVKWDYAFELYNLYCEKNRIPEKMQLRSTKFREEMKPYFRKYVEKGKVDEHGVRQRHLYYDFRTDKFDGNWTNVKQEEKSDSENSPWLIFEEGIPSIFDEEASSYFAQYAESDGERVGLPIKGWDFVKSVLSELDTHRLHYVRVPINHIVIDFDIRGPSGEKDFNLNYEEALKWPPTYAELSKSGAGIHLHYIYLGDATKLSSVYSDKVEIKVFTGKSSLRRLLSKCNRLPIATISSGLPFRKEKPVFDKNVLETQQSLTTKIMRACNKDYEAMPKTIANVQFIKYILDQAYESGVIYDVSNLMGRVFEFASQSTNNSIACSEMVCDMHFKSSEETYDKHLMEQEEQPVEDEKPIVFFDIEVVPNLLLVCYKLEGDGVPVTRLFNPTPEQLMHLTKYRLIGFNNRKYDNHIIYARMQGYSIEGCYQLSKDIIGKKKNASFIEAYNLSYTDVYDFASAGNKMSLKKMEIKMGIHHQELHFDWDEPIPEEMWDEVADYCENDVIATEKAFLYLSADWTARQILADLAGMSVNTPTNTLTTRIIFGKNKKPQSQFNYRDLSKPVTHLEPEEIEFLNKYAPGMVPFDDKSLLPYFPGYKCELKTLNPEDVDEAWETDDYIPSTAPVKTKKTKWVSTYREFNPSNPDPKYRKVGEGGCVYSTPGTWGNVALLDITSQHPTSTKNEILFGLLYTQAYWDIVRGRVSIKHEAWDEINTLMDGKLTKYISKVQSGEMTSGQLADALKTAINSVYGLTSAGFENAFKDPRNYDNIVAKRGALFMIDLKHAVEERGFVVAHIKTDSIKIPDATLDIIEFVMAFGRHYGYSFEHEATYDRMCLIDKAQYIAKYKDPELCKAMYGYIPDKNKKKKGWTATGTKFQIPYVFKKLFSKEEIVFSDLCATFESKAGDIYLDQNESLMDVSIQEKELDKAYEKFRKGKISDTTLDSMKAELEPIIFKGHDYVFVGKVGLFVPVKSGTGGGIMYYKHKQSGKYMATAGSTGYRWREAEELVSRHSEDTIDIGYWNALVDDAKYTINTYGDYERFIDDIPFELPKYDEKGAPIYDSVAPYI